MHYHEKPEMDYHRMEGLPALIDIPQESLVALKDPLNALHQRCLAVPVRCPAGAVVSGTGYMKVWSFDFCEQVAGVPLRP
jgi:hypothetical protein